MPLSDLLGQPLVPLPGLWPIELPAQLLYIRKKAHPTLGSRDRKEFIHQAKSDVTAIHEKTDKFHTAEQQPQKILVPPRQGFVLLDIDGTRQLDFWTYPESSTIK